MTTEKSPSESTPKPPSLIKKKNIIVIGLVFAGLWTLAIASGSLIFMGIAGGITLLGAGFGYWVWRQIRRHRALSSVMQEAQQSPEGRMKALAALEADPKANDLVNVIARAQLLASEEPTKALSLLEPVDLKDVPGNMQDDFALLKSQLLLSFGRPKQARPLVDQINLDSEERKSIRPLMVAVVAETWARTGAPKKANEVLDSIDLDDAASADFKPLLLGARVFARFAAGKKGLARAALEAVAAEDPNLLGRFISPKAKVHPGLQRLARESFERNGPRQQRQRGRR